jgi:hypothetical protein
MMAAGRTQRNFRLYGFACVLSVAQRAASVSFPLKIVRRLGALAQIIDLNMGIYLALFGDRKFFGVYQTHNFILHRFMGLFIRVFCAFFQAANLKYSLDV